MPDFKELKNKIKHGDFQFVYDELKKSDFEYTLENIEKEFTQKNINQNTPKYC